MRSRQRNLSREIGLKWVRILRKAALAGRRGVRDNYDIESRMKVLDTGAGGDLTLEIDDASESRILKSLQNDLGKDSFVFLSEEIGELKSNGEDPRPIIICDPLDGSHNAQVGIPLFSISLSVLGLSRNIAKGDKRFLGDVDVGFILNIPTGEEYYAIKGFGAVNNKGMIANTPKFRNPRRVDFTTIGIECGDVDLLKRAIKPFTSNNLYKLRVLGSAAISFCLLADSSIDGLLFLQPKGARTIDCPAGFLIASEAGRVFSILGDRSKVPASVEVGFDSRVNIVGGKDRRALSDLLELVRI